MGRGQIAMEYLLVAGFAFVLLVPIIIIAYTQSAQFSTDVTAAQVQKVGSTIVDNVNAAYYAGPPTKRTLRLYFPEKITSITIANSSIIFEVQGTPRYNYVAFAAANMTGTLRPYAGLHTITITADDPNVNVTDS